MSITRLRGLVLCALALSSCGGCGLERTTDRPHVLLIVADDLGWADVGYHGSEIRTPSIDRLAASGVRAEQFYVLPTCSATRAALLTGRYPVRYGLQRDVIRPWESYGLDPSETTLAQALGAAGYATALVGKWHLGMARVEQLPTTRGFQHHYGFYGGSIDYLEHTHFDGLDWHRNGVPLQEGGYSTDLLAAETVRLVEDHDQASPLFMMLAFNAPHTPLLARPDDLEAYEEIVDGYRQRYAAVVTRMDHAIGQVLDAFEDAGMRQNTLVLFVSDNGAYLDSGGRNAPLRGEKGSLFDGGIRVPAVWSWPAALPSGTGVDAPMHVVDVFSTVLAAAGVPPSSETPLDGIDSLPILRGAPAAEREILLNLDERQAALRVGRWKLMVLGSVESPSRTALFDVAADPGERRDFSARRPAQVQKLLARLVRLREISVPALSESPARPSEYQPPEVWGPAPH